MASLVAQPPQAAQPAAAAPVATITAAPPRSTAAAALQLDGTVASGADVDWIARRARHQAQTALHQRRAGGGGGGSDRDRDDLRMGSSNSVLDRDVRDRDADRPPVAGWSSIRHQSGRPFQPLGAPILDFVFKVQKRGRTGAAQQQQQQQQAQQQQQEEEQKDSSKQAAADSTAPASVPSLDVVDPIRDLLSLCTPRRADVLEASLAIRQRVALAQARLTTARAGGNAAKQQSLREMQASLQLGDNAQLGLGDFNAYASPVATAVASSASPFSAETPLSQDDLASSLIQSKFALLTRLLASGELNPSTAPESLLDLSARLGGAFPPNFNSNAFTNLQPHPDMARMAAAAATAGTASGAQTARAAPKHGRRRMHGAASARARSTSPPPVAAAPSDPLSPASTTARFFPTAPAPPSPPLSLAHLFSPSHIAHAPPPALSFHHLRYALHQSFGTLAQQREQEAALAEKAARKAAMKKEKAQAAAIASASQHMYEESNGGVTTDRSFASSQRNADGSFDSARSQAAASSGSASARSTHGGAGGVRRRGRSRNRGAAPPTAAELSSAAADAAAALHAPPASSATSRDVGYTRAVHGSKYRREHHNSPTSHWNRLQENIQQRYTQMRALANMDYFAPASHRKEKASESAQQQQQDQEEERKEADPHDLTSRFLSRSARSGGASTARSGASSAIPKSIHSGQLLRQVANTSWESFESGAAGGDAAGPGGLAVEHTESSYAGSIGANPYANLTHRACLSLARCYADFDLAKRDLKERLLESLALQDTQRPQVLASKFKHFRPRFEEAPQDIIQMRHRAEEQRQRVMVDRIRNYTALYALVQYINQQNGGNNGEPTSATESMLSSSAAAAAAAAAASASGSGAAAAAGGPSAPLPLCFTSLPTPGPTGMVGCVHGAALPTLEEVYVVEVIASLADSGIAMLPEVKGAEHGGAEGEQAAEQALHPAARGPVSPPASLLLLLLSLDRSVFRIKEVRDLLERWVRLVGIGEEVLDSALKMVDVDPKEAVYSGRNSNKAAAAAAAAATAKAAKAKAARNTVGGADGVQGLSSVPSRDTLDPVAQPASSSSSTALRDLLSSTAPPLPPLTTLLPSVAASKPLSRVILAPVSLGDWEWRKAAERAKMAAAAAQHQARLQQEQMRQTISSARLKAPPTQAAAGTPRGHAVSYPPSPRAHADAMHHQRTASGLSMSLGVLREEHDGSSAAVDTLADDHEAQPSPFPLPLLPLAPLVPASPAGSYRDRALPTKQRTGSSHAMATAGMHGRVNLTQQQQQY